MDGNAISGALVRLTFVLVCAAFALGSLVVWGLPKFVEYVKSWIHAVTS